MTDPSSYVPSVQRLKLPVRLVVAMSLLVVSCASVRRSPVPPPPPPPSVPPPAGAEEPVRRGDIVPARSYLLSGNAEEPGYGLYSYVLLPHPPLGTEQLTRYTTLAEAYHAVIQPVGDFLDMGYDKRNLGITYWLLGEVDRREIPRHEEKADWSFFIHAYDYARAQAMLVGLDMLGKPGPFIIAATSPIRPLASQPLDRQQLLVFDLSRINEEEFVSMLQLYEEKASHPKAWPPPRFDPETIKIVLVSALTRYSDSALSLVKVIFR